MSLNSHMQKSSTHQLYNIIIKNANHFHHYTLQLNLPSQLASLNLYFFYLRETDLYTGQFL